MNGTQFIAPSVAIPVGIEPAVAHHTVAVVVGTDTVVPPLDMSLVVPDILAHTADSMVAGQADKAVAAADSSVAVADSPLIMH